MTDGCRKNSSGIKWALSGGLGVGMSIPRILIIDDNEGARVSLSGLLRLEGFDALTAETGRRGIDLALAERTDVILVDLHLPDISGLDVVRTLKARGVATPMVVVTVFPDLETVHDAEEVGADGYVEGLLFVDELLQVVTAALHGRRPVRHPTLGLSHAAFTDPPSLTLPTAVPRVPRDHRIRRIVRAMEDERETAWSTTRLARHVHLSPSRLRHLFADTMGLPLRRFMRELRLKKAARLLLTTSESFHSIAERLCLPRDLRAVRSAFRARFGMPPRPYRRRFGRLVRIDRP